MFGEELETILLDAHGKELRSLSKALWSYAREGRLDRMEWLSEALASIVLAVQRELKKRGR